LLVDRVDRPDGAGGGVVSVVSLDDEVAVALVAVERPNLLADLRLAVGDELGTALVLRDDADLDESLVEARIGLVVRDHVEQGFR